MAIGERREQLRQEYVAIVCDAVKRYILDGHAFRLETVADGDDDARRITFEIGDWEAFRKLLEPGSPECGASDAEEPEA